MVIIRNSAILVTLVLVSACGVSKVSDSALASKIEQTVIAAYPDLDLDKYAHFYSHEDSIIVSGIYLFANDGQEPFHGKTGHSYWVPPGDLPIVNDGGCSVINVTYNRNTGRLTSFFCNGDA